METISQNDKVNFQHNLQLNFGIYDYDRTRPLANGTVKIPGVDSTFEHPKIVTEIFERMITRIDFDVAEMGMSYFLRIFDKENCPFVAIPVFVNRVFRHSAIYINTSSNIKKPEDLNGKRIGEFALYSHDAGTWPKGILADEFGFKAEQCSWVIGGLDWPMTSLDFLPQPHPANVKVTRAPEGKDLGAMLDVGEIDALITADVPKCYLERSPNVARLFTDAKRTEQDYYERTGIFPMMHLVVIKKELVEEYPGLCTSIYKGFCEAKDAAMEDYKFRKIFNNMDIMFPWFSDMIEEDIQVLGKDWWPYGVNANRNAVDTFLRYHYEQGISKNLLTCQDIFPAELLDS
jgi:hypothetical protein